MKTVDPSSWPLTPEAPVPMCRWLTAHQPPAPSTSTTAAAMPAHLNRLTGFFPGSLAGSAASSTSASFTLVRLHPEINTLFLATGSGAYGACRAVESSGMAKKLRVVCYDNTPLLAEMLKKQVISATVCQEPERQGAEPLRILFDYLALGMNPERNVVYTDNEIMIRECL